MILFDERKALSLLSCFRFTAKGKFYTDTITFDIETSTIDKNKCIMYIWMMNINGVTFYHYDWKVFQHFVNELKSFTLNFCIWVHNLSFEFAFMQEYFSWEKVFCTSPHKVIFAKTDNVLFRCTYFMTNLPLSKLPKVYELPVKKLVGDLDYSKIRLPKITPLTEAEKCYCENDVLILYYFIEKMKERYHDFVSSKLPYTATGFTRKHLREKAEKNKQYGLMRNIVKEASVTDIIVYNMLQRAFAGGYAHGNYIFCKNLFEPVEGRAIVRSRDKKSFYPSMILKYKYPRTFFKAKPEKLLHLIKKDYAVIMDICFYNLKAKTTMTTISEHKCSYLKNYDVDNGRIYSAEKLVTTITEQDFEIINLYYDYDKIKIGRCYASKKRYLPKAFLETVLDLYENKTVLKDVKGSEQEYQALKALLNSLFGCCVTDIIQPVILYNENTREFINKELTNEEKAEALESYRMNYQSILLYQTGVYITAYARNEILKENWVLGEQRVIYNDTDSTKYLFDDFSEEFFESENAKNIEMLKESCKANGLDFERTHPKDIYGNSHQLGEMGYEADYEYFKMLGAKRYLTYSKKEGLKATIAGLPKVKAQNFFLSGLWENEYQGAPTIKEVFSKFRNQMFIPSDFSGKNTHYYTEKQGEIELTDYKGNKGIFYVGYGISLIPQPFEMNLSASYRAFIENHISIDGFSHCERLSDVKMLTRIKTLWGDL